MPKRFFRRFTGEVKNIRNHPHLQFFGMLLHDHRLWHFHRRNLASGVAIGLFAAFVPLPMQMVLAAALAILFRANLPVAVSLVWLTNPVTIPPVLFLTYAIGAFILDLPPNPAHMELSLAWMQTTFAHSWRPLVLGSLVLGVICALLGYILIHWIWVIMVRRAWRVRHDKRLAHPLVKKGT